MAIEDTTPLVAVVVAQEDDWAILQHASATLTELAVAHTCHVVSAHDAPRALAEFVGTAEQVGVEVFVAGGAGSTSPAVAIAAHTLRPVLGVPLESPLLRGLDALTATVQTPAGTPVGSLAIGRAGAINAALLAAQILALGRPELARRIQDRRAQQTTAVLAATLP